MKMDLSHYYGDIVRYLFLGAGLIMVISLPVFDAYIDVPLIISVICIAILGIAAGFTNPKQLVSSVVNFVISVIGFVIFLYTGVYNYQHQIGNDKFVLTTLILAAIFIFAVYFSMKTLRAELLRNGNEETK